MTTFFLVRHGETEWNTQRRIQGWADSPLTSLGLAQAEAHGRLLGKFRIDRVLASPLGRTKQTVVPIVQETGVVAEYDDRLREVCMGDWSGRTAQELQSRHLDQWQARLDDPEGYCPPNGESRLDVKRRVAPLITELIDAPQQMVVLVSHGITIRILLDLLLGSSKHRKPIRGVPNDLVYCVTRQSSDATVTHYVNGAGPFEGLFIPEV
ncbi:MAG: histidine phosphatase family protein [Pseudomonadota bacterium]|nr:histidine phosphatase family protein [Pseudomonadota bacterium]